MLDTNVIISALMSRRGASFQLLRQIGTGKFDLHLSVPLVLEYEQVALRTHWVGKQPDFHISNILDYICSVGYKHKIHFLWRPRAKDPKDDMVLEAAVAGQCDSIITFNKKDFSEAASFGIDLLTPQEFLKSIGELS